MTKLAGAFKAMALSFLGVALLLAYTDLGGTDAPCPQSGWQEEPDAFLRYLHGLGPPEYVSIHPRTVRDKALAAVRTGHFNVAGRPVDLTMPINWRQDPYNDRSWRFWLHSLVLLEPLLQGHGQSGDPLLLRKAVDITLDWLGQNQRGAKGISNFAWYDMAVPARAAYMAYLLRAAAVAEVITPQEAAVLGRHLEDHADWLAQADNYTVGHNHGLFQDVGLFVAAYQFPEHPKSGCWEGIARGRFASTVAATVALDDGIHLEHSPGYHVGITALLKRFQALGIGGADLKALVERMSDGAGWLVMPDNRYPQLGDTDLNKAPGWVKARARPLQGLKLFHQGGYGIVKRPESYLILAAGYHGRGHKHADELHLSWYDKGRRILVDTGRYGYYYHETGRRYAESSRAHNGVEFRGEPFTWRGAKPYGSGLLGGGLEAGWYVLAAKNPLVEQVGVQHRRLVLYAPGEQLLVVDETLPPEPMNTTRYFHFAPGLDLAPRADGDLAIVGEGFEGRICDLSGRGDVTIRRVAGVREPEVQGFTFPANRKWAVAPTALLETQAAGRFLVTGIDLGVGEQGGFCAGRRRVTLEWNGQTLSFGGALEEASESLRIAVATPMEPGGDDKVHSPMQLSVQDN